MVSEWVTFMRSFRNSNPDIPYKTAQKKASILYKNSCNKTNLKKKISRMDNSEIQEVCRKLDNVPVPPVPPVTPVTPDVIEKYTLLREKKTEKPALSKQSKPKKPSRTAPKRPKIFLIQELKRELTKLKEKVFLRAAYYFASSNVWNYKKNMIEFTNKYIKKINNKFSNLTKEEKKNTVREILGDLKTLSKNDALNEKYKTSKVAYEKIIDFMNKRYP